MEPLLYRRLSGISDMSRGVSGEIISSGRGERGGGIDTLLLWCSTSNGNVGESGRCAGGGGGGGDADRTAT